MNTTRRGKIARLPEAIRETLNSRLEDGWTGRKLVAWLNTLPEVRAMMETDWDGKPIRAQNLSEWKHGGYRDWQDRREARSLAAQLGQEAPAPRASDQKGRPITTSDRRLPSPDLLATWLTARYAVNARQLIVPGSDPVKTLKMLRKLCRDITQLRRGDHSAERLRLAKVRLNLAGTRRERYRAEPPAEKSAPARPPLSNAGQQARGHTAARPPVGRASPVSSTPHAAGANSPEHRKPQIPPMIFKSFCPSGTAGHNTASFRDAPKAIRGLFPERSPLPAPPMIFKTKSARSSTG